MSLALEPQVSSTKAALDLTSQNIPVDASARSIGSDISKSTRSSLSRAVSDLTSGGPIERSHIPARHSEQTPGAEHVMICCASLSVGVFLPPQHIHPVHVAI